MFENGATTFEKFECYFLSIWDRVNRASHGNFTSHHRPIFPAKTRFFHQPKQAHFASRGMTGSQAAKLPIDVATTDSQISKLLVDGQCFPRPRTLGFWNWRGSLKSAVLR